METRNTDITTQQLVAQATVIRDETLAGQNTARRVGKLLVELAQKQGADAENLASLLEAGQTARFHAVYDTGTIIESATASDGGRVVFVRTANRFGYEYPPTEDAASRSIYGAWPTWGDFHQPRGGAVWPDKVYLSQSRAYMWDNAANTLREIGEGGYEVDVTAGFSVLDGLRADPARDILLPYRLMFSRSATVRLCVGYLYCFDDPSAHGTTQILLCNYVEGAGGTLDFTAHKDGSASLYLRYYNRAAPGVSGEIPQGSWGEWQHIGGSRLAQEVARLRAETVTFELIT